MRLCTGDVRSPIATMRPSKLTFESLSQIFSKANSKNPACSLPVHARNSGQNDWPNSGKWKCDLPPITADDATGHFKSSQPGGMVGGNNTHCFLSNSPPPRPSSKRISPVVAITYVFPEVYSLTAKRARHVRTLIDPRVLFSRSGSFSTKEAV